MLVHKTSEVRTAYRASLTRRTITVTLAAQAFDVDGNLISNEEFEQQSGEWLPTTEDRQYVRSLMMPVTERGKIANWIAPPASGINGNPFDFEYVRL